MKKFKLKRAVALLLAVIMVISMMNLSVLADAGDQSPVVNVDGLAITEESVPICGLEESEGHTHDESCYTTEQVLTCEIPENHVHTVDCYQLADPDFGMGTEMEINGQVYLVDHIICEIPERHVHTDECYETREVLTCGLEESEGHTHTDACYAPVEPEATEPVEVAPEITEPTETGPQVTETMEPEPEVTETVTPEIVKPTGEPAPVEPDSIEELPQGEPTWPWSDQWYESNAFFFILKPEYAGEYLSPTDSRFDLGNSTGKWISAGTGIVSVKGQGVPGFDIVSHYPVGETSIIKSEPAGQYEDIVVGGITYKYNDKSSDHYYTVKWVYTIGAYDGCSSSFGGHWHVNGYAVLSDAPTETTGSLVIKKEIKVDGGGSLTAFDNTTFQFEVKGPSYPDGKVFEITGASQIMIGDLQPGQYTVTELEPSGSPANYTLENNYNSQTVEVKQAANASSVTITNTYKYSPNTGSLTIAKAVVGGGDEATSKVYTFDVTGPNDYSKTVAITGNTSVTLTGLALGTYTVTERDANIEGYKLDTTVEGNATVTAGGTAEVTVTNTYTELGKLTIQKAVDGGGDEAANKVYTFIVVGPDGYKNESITITGNGNITLKNLVPGDYTVTEQNADIPGYNLEVTGGGTVTVEAGETTEVTVTNKYTPKPGSLKITKTVDGGPDDATTSKVYTFTVTGPSYPKGQEKTITITGGSCSKFVTHIFPSFKKAD